MLSIPGMDILNGAIDSLIGSSNKEDWTPVALNVADATVTISKDEVRFTSAAAEPLPPTSSACHTISALRLRNDKYRKTKGVDSGLKCVISMETSKTFFHYERKCK